jgi:two-component system response regulator AtoC
MTQTSRTDELLLNLSLPDELRNDVSCAARSDTCVLVTADTSSTRHEIARCIHQKSERKKGPFAVLNCGGPEEVLYSLLFGHRAGSFADARGDSPGWFEQMNGGTLVLDDVGSLSPQLQDAVVNFLEADEIRPLGAESAGTAVDVRIISATSTDLHALTLKGLFRDDLFYRLNVIHLVLPPSTSPELRAAPQAHVGTAVRDCTKFL